jgi:hypothetical protein
VSALAPLLECQWETLDEAHSVLTEIRVGLGTGPSAMNLLNGTSLSPQARFWSYNARDILSGLHDTTELYVIMEASNSAGNKTFVPIRVINDLTPPSVSEVIVVTSPLPGFHDVKQQCQTAEDYMEVLVTGIEDKESGIKRYIVNFLYLPLSLPLWSRFLHIQ